MLIDQKNTIIGSFISYNLIKVFKPVGRIDFNTYGNVRLQIMELIQTSPDVLVIDMEDVDFIDSKGLSLLINILKIMQINGGKLILTKISRELEMLLEITKTDKLFEIGDLVAAKVN